MGISVRRANYTRYSHCGDVQCIENTPGCNFDMGSWGFLVLSALFNNAAH